MAIGKVTVTFDKASVVARLKSDNEKALMIMGEQVKKDCNLYCPVDQNTMLKSSESHSVIKNGVYPITWDTPYAKKMYYIGGKFTKKRAHKMWAHYATSIHVKEWNEVYQKALKN